MQKILILSMLIGFFACKKGDDEQKKDYSALFNKTIWTGEYLPDGNTLSLPFSLEFSTTNMVHFHDHSGTHQGTYSLEGDRITLNFPGISAGLSAIVSADNKLTQFEKTGSQHWKMQSANLLFVTDQIYNSTIWKQTHPTGQNRQIKFASGEVVVINNSSIYYYTKIAGAFRISNSDQNFGVFMSTTTFKLTSGIGSSVIEVSTFSKVE